MPRKIVSKPDIMMGKPTFEGTRITVQVILEMLSNDYSPERLAEEYDALEVEDIHNALRYAAEFLGHPIKMIAAE